MKLFILVFTLTSLCACLLCAEPLEAAFRISLTEQGLDINGITTEIPARLENIEKILGKAERIEALKNEIHVWDSLGLLVYCKPGSTIVHDFSVALSPQPFVYWPASMFKGTVTIDGNVITADGGTDCLKKAGLMQHMAIVTYWEKPAGESVIVAETDIDTGQVCGVGMSVSW